MCIRLEAAKITIIYNSLLSKSVVREIYMKKIQMQFIWLIFASLFYGSIVRAEAVDDLITISSNGAFDCIPDSYDSFKFLTDQFQGISVDLNIPVIVRLTDDWPYRKLIKFIDEAKSLALKDQAPSITMKHIDMSFDTIDSGLKMTETFEELKNAYALNFNRNAIHEAGHVVSYLYNQAECSIVYKATIEIRIHKHSDSGSGGFVLSLPRDIFYSLNINDFENTIITNWCGGVAEQLFGFSTVSQEVLTDNDKILELSSEFNLSGDMEDARRYARIIVTRLNEDLNEEQIEEKINRIIIDSYKKSYEFIMKHKIEVQKVADLLLEKGTVSGDEIYNLLGLHRSLYDDGNIQSFDYNRFFYGYNFDIDSLLETMQMVDGLESTDFLSILQKLDQSRLIQSFFQLYDVIQIAKDNAHNKSPELSLDDVKIDEQDFTKAVAFMRNKLQQA